MSKKVMISFELGRTISLGDFENVKIAVGIDVNTNTDEMGFDFEQAKKWVGDRLRREEERWQGEKK